MNHLFVLGGARSGKSRYAQQRAEALDRACVYVATAQPYDDEMRDRIQRHQADRDGCWTTIEAPIDLPGAVRSISSADNLLLIDCMTLWVSNLILGDYDVNQAINTFIQALAGAPDPIILVSNEVGLSIVPDNALARRFRDAAGIINQRIAAAVEEVQFIAAGLPIRLK